MIRVRVQWAMRLLLLRIECKEESKADRWYYGRLSQVLGVTRKCDRCGGKNKIVLKDPSIILPKRHS